MNPEIQELMDDFKKGNIDRRDFMRKMTILSGSVAWALMPGSEALSDIVAKDDPRLVTEMVRYQGAEEMMAYLARPKGDERLPAVIVIHENRGLNDHIKDVTRRMALEGFVALAPDALSSQGGTPEDPEKSRPMFQNLSEDVTEENFAAAVQYLATNPLTNGNVGCTGFCWGGGMTNVVAVRVPELKAAVPYYGRQPDPADVPKIQAAMLIHYAGNDERINAGIPAFEEALKAAKVEYQIFMYEGAGHAFNNDTGQRYNKEAADLAWQRTIEFFKKKLK